MADRLRVLLINDEREKLETFRSLLDIDHAQEPEQAQALLLKSLNTGQAYDIVACDVNFEGSETVRQFIRSNGQDAAIVPLGPILALPFLSSRTTVFVPYSSYWTQLRYNPDIMLLAAFGMISARSYRRVMPLIQVADRLHRFEELEDFDSLPGSFVTALARGLREYREMLFADPTRLLNVGWVAHELNALKEQNAWPPQDFESALALIECAVERDLDAPPIPSLLRGSKGILALEVGKVRRSRGIALASLYADYFLSSLNPNDVTRTATTESIYAHAFLAITDDLDAAARDLPGGSIGEFTLEIAQTLKLADQDGEHWGRGDTITAVLRKRRSIRASRFADVEEGHFLRACVLGAWLRAWRLHLDGYLSQRQIKPTMKRLLGISPAEKDDKNDGTTLYRRLFINESSNDPKRDSKGEVSWAQPFRPDRSGLDRWNLELDEPAQLTPSDRSFCEAYAALSDADGGLDWTTGADGDQAPIWMTTLA